MTRLIAIAFATLLLGSSSFAAAAEVAQPASERAECQSAAEGKDCGVAVASQGDGDIVSSVTPMEEPAAAMGACSARIYPDCQGGALPK